MNTCDITEKAHKLTIAYTTYSALKESEKIDETSFYHRYKASFQLFFELVKQCEYDQ